MKDPKEFISLKDYIEEVEQIFSNSLKTGEPITGDVWKYLCVRCVRVTDEKEEKELKNVRKGILKSAQDLYKTNPGKVAQIEVLIKEVDSDVLDSSFIQNIFRIKKVE